jgi:hypothetical protein
MAGDLEGVWRVGNVSIWSWCQFRDALAASTATYFSSAEKTRTLENHKGCGTPFRNQGS